MGMNVLFQSYDKLADFKSFYYNELNVLLALILTLETRAQATNIIIAKVCIYIIMYTDLCYSLTQNTVK